MWSLVVGPTYGVGYTCVLLVMDEPVGAAVRQGVISGVFMGLFMGPLLAWLHARARAAAGPVPHDVRMAAGRALLRGPVPADPLVRATALRLAEHQLAENARWRSWNLLGTGAFTLLGLVLLVVGSGWALLLVGAAGALFALALWLPGRLERRARLLREAPPGAPALSGPGPSATVARQSGRRTEEPGASQR